MKKFKFRLDGILKLREFEEKKAKLNLGKVINKMEMVKNEILRLKKEIGEGYGEMEDLLKDSVDGRTLQFFPSYFEGKKAMIKKLEVELSNLNEELKFRRLELKRAEGEFKSIDKLREKGLKKFKADALKKEQLDMDDNTIMKYGRSHE